MASTAGAGGHRDPVELDLCRILHPSYWMPTPAGPREALDDEPETGPEPVADGTGPDAAPDFADVADLDVHLELHLATVVRIEDIPGFVAARRHRSRSLRPE